MRINKSQKLIIVTIFSGVLGLPNIEKVFTEKLIELVMEDPSPLMVFLPAPTTALLISIIKIMLVLLSIMWLIQLIQNIKITYNTKREDQFQNYILTLFLTAIITFISSILIRAFFFI